MARRRGISGSKGGGFLRTLESAGVSRGVFGASKGWFYVGTGLWTLRKVRTLGQRKPEILLAEELRPGQRIIIANGRATIEDAPLASPVALAAPKGRRAKRRARQNA
ncbi:MAG: hypothetical protein ABIP03_08555 [Aquihabitans sp.]